MGWNDDFVTDIINDERKAFAFDDVENIMKKGLGQALVTKLQDLKIQRMAIEAVKNFDVELVLDYLELTGIPWITWTGIKCENLPSEDMVRHFLAHKLGEIIQKKKSVEFHLPNNFIVFYDGTRITIIYSITSVMCGKQIGKM